MCNHGQDDNTRPVPEYPSDCVTLHITVDPSVMPLHDTAVCVCVCSVYSARVCSQLWGVILMSYLIRVELV